MEEITDKRFKFILGFKFNVKYHRMEVIDTQIGKKQAKDYNYT